MKYLVFNTEEEALIAEKQISEDLGYSKPGVNAATGEIEPTVLTTRWDIPRKIKDGRWIITSPTDEGVDYDENWFDKINENAIKSNQII